MHQDNVESARLRTDERTRGGTDVSETHVLIVDDDPDIRHLAAMSFSMQSGVTVHQADSGRSALEMLETLQPSFMVVDVMMPELDGPSLFAKMQQNPRLQSIPVVFLTAKVQRHEVQELTDLGAAGVLAKPFDPFTLAAQVTDLVGRTLA